MAKSDSKAPPTEPVTAVIGDLVASRQLSPSDRREVQVQLRQFLSWLNQEYRAAVLSDFVITTGDEFQALLRDPELIPDLAWELKAKLGNVGVRLGIGFGTIYTPLRPVAIGMDGPAFHRARVAITKAAKKGWIGGVFLGFTDPGDKILNGFARVLHRHRTDMTNRQREVAAMLRRGEMQSEVAEMLAITKQAVSDHVTAMGWEEYFLAETGWRAALKMLGSANGARTRDELFLA